MKRATLATICGTAVIAFAAGYGLSVVSRAPQDSGVEPAQVRTTCQYKLRNAAVLEAAERIKGALSTDASASDDLPPRLVADAVANSLLVTGSARQHAAVRSLIAEIDADPIIVQMESILTRIGPDGTRTVLSRPTIQTLDQTTGMISIGQSGGEGLELTLTPKVILPDRLKEAHNAANVNQSALLAR